MGNDMHSDPRFSLIFAFLIVRMVEVHRMFKLLPETLFLTSAITDRYLAATVVRAII